jgi:hypothetical protein
MEQNNKTVDATEPFRIRGSIVDAMRAVAQDRHRCFWANAIMRIPGVYDTKVDMCFTQIKFDSNPEVAVRYQNPPEMVRLIKINEKGIKQLARALKWVGGHFDVELRVPPRKISLEHFRSPEFKALRAASRQRRKNQPRRGYTKPSTKGYRSGVGRAHMWHEDVVR